jgi:hypothetical protein
MVGKVGVWTASPSSVVEGSKNRSEMRPGAKLAVRGVRATIKTAVGVGIPVSSEDVIRGEAKRVRGKRVKEAGTGGAVGGSVDVGDAKRATLVAERRR